MYSIVTIVTNTISYTENPLLFQFVVRHLTFTKDLHKSVFIN